MFAGFSQETVDFLWGIRFNNERGWFLEHKDEFKAFVDEPIRLLAHETADVIMAEHPKLDLQMKVSRIYRDARRLHGRGPYKDHLWFSIRRPAERGCAVPCLYFELAPECWRYGVGCYDATALTMAKLRAGIDRDPRQLEKLARRLNRQEEFRLEGERYKRPKGDPGKLLEPWYNRRWLGVVSEQNCEGDFFTPALRDRVVEGFRFLMPYYEYLDRLTAEPDPRTPV